MAARPRTGGLAHQRFGSRARSQTRAWQSSPRFCPRPIRIPSRGIIPQTPGRKLNRASNTSTIKLPQSCASVRLETIKETGALAVNPLQMQPDEGQWDVAKIERAGRMTSGAPMEANATQGRNSPEKDLQLQAGG